MVTIEEQAAAYEASRIRIDSLTRGLDEPSLARTVPCCPEWTVLGAVGHLTGVLEDRRDGRMPSGGFGEWTESHVQRHMGEPIGEVLDTWLAIEVVPDESPPSLTALSFDVVTHEHDICHALGVRGERDTQSVWVGSERALERMGILIEQHGAPGVVVALDGEQRALPGSGDSLSLKIGRYELMRLVTGRISRRQAMALAWEGDPTAVIDALYVDGFFTPQPADVVEA